MRKLTIHATNVTGLGAARVVVSLLEAIESLETDYDCIDCLIPEHGAVAEYVPRSKKLKVLPFQRKGPKALSRVIECLFPSIFFQFGEHLIVLGDVPLRTRRKQLVLVHQAHLLSPRINSRVARSAIFRVTRALTQFNAPFADCVIAQTCVMASGLRESYQDWADRDCVKVIGQPPPSSFELPRRTSSFQHDKRGLRLFYPAADYPHKNHAIFEALLPLDMNEIVDQLVLTLPTKRFSSEPKWLCCVGHLSHTDCLSEYKKADALVFPSLLESYGLPLVEAMALGIPVIASDLPYARVLCGNEGIYFDPSSADSLIKACEDLKARLIRGWQPDWSSRLESMPSTWAAVASEFLSEFK